MSKPLTRAQYIQKGRSYRRFNAFVFSLQRLGSRHKSTRQERFIDTPFGRVRTLWYGFEDPQPAPVYFDLHGGGFVLGSAGMDETMNTYVHRQVGCKVISIDYAKAPDFPYPAAVDQVYAVVGHVVANAEKYAIDPARIAIGGHSAGGNLAAVACLKAKADGQFQFACQVMDYPVLDLAADPWQKPYPKGAIPPGMAAMFNACYIDPARAKEPYASPVYAAPADLTGLPPALFILAGGDSLHDEGLQYCRMLQAAGVSTECHEYPNAGHGFTYAPSADTTAALAQMAAFLKKYLTS